MTPPDLPVRYAPDLPAAAPDAPDVDVPVDVEPPLDVPDVPDVSDVPDTAPAEPLCEPSPSVAGSNDFELIVGRLVAGQFTELADGEEIEIIQGPQGGVHLEVAVRLVPPAPLAEELLLTATEATTIQPCGGADQAVVGDFNNKKLPVYPLTEPGPYQSQKLLVIFDEDEAVHYAARPCAVQVTVAFDSDDGTTLAASATKPLYCVDYF